MRVDMRVVFVTACIPIDSVPIPHIIDRIVATQDAEFEFCEEYR
jgi:hypothetical protein